MTLEIIEAAAAVFHSRVVEAETFLQGRGFLWANLGDMQIGVADSVAIRELERDWSTAQLLDAGLLIEAPGRKPYPRFRNRLMFPIFDVDRRVVGFSGRTLTDAEPKYLNSPTSDVFDKGRLLYNLHNAGPVARTLNKMVLVEGNFDVLRFRLCGVRTVVAPLGTALTPAQAEIISEHAKVCYVAFDRDAAGGQATIRAGEILLRAGVDVRVVVLPDGHDPDSAGREFGGEAVVDWLTGALDLIDWRIQCIRAADGFRDIARKRAALDHLLKLAGATPLPLLRTIYVQRIAEAVGIGRAVIADAIERPEPLPTRPRRRKPGVPAWQRALDEALGR